jgi:hypothetical protein
MNLLVFVKVLQNFDGLSRDEVLNNIYSTDGVSISNVPIILINPYFIFGKFTEEL